MLAAVVRVGKRFERPPAEESSARAERPSRLVDVLTVVKERLFLLDNVTLSPILPEFYGWPPMCSLASVASSSRNVPAGQSVQASLSSVSAYLPAAHMEQPLALPSC